jgi:hypothetical protein
VNPRINKVASTAGSRLARVYRVPGEKGEDGAIFLG